MTRCTTSMKPPRLRAERLGKAEDSEEKDRIISIVCGYGEVQEYHCRRRRHDQQKQTDSRTRTSSLHCIGYVAFATWTIAVLVTSILSTSPFVTAFTTSSTSSQRRDQLAVVADGGYPLSSSLHQRLFSIHGQAYGTTTALSLFGKRPPTASAVPCPPSNGSTIDCSKGRASYRLDMSSTGSRSAGGDGAVRSPTDQQEWRAILMALQLYKAAYGDLKVPTRFVVPSLAPWPGMCHASNID